MGCAIPLSRCNDPEMVEAYDSVGERPHGLSRGRPRCVDGNLRAPELYTWFLAHTRGPSARGRLPLPSRTADCLNGACWRSWRSPWRRYSVRAPALPHPGPPRAHRWRGARAAVAATSDRLRTAPPWPKPCAPIGCRARRRAGSVRQRWPRCRPCRRAPAPSLPARGMIREQPHAGEMEQRKGQAV